MKKILNKLNFLIGIVSIVIFYLPGVLLGEFAIIATKVIGKIFNSIISIFPSIYLRGFVDIIFEAFAFTAIGRGLGVAFIIFVPILIFRKFTKLNINWIPSIVILIPLLLWFGGIRQIQRYAELYEGIYLVSISAGFILGTFLPLYYAYLFTKK
jgi:hypothetical protein